MDNTLDYQSRDRRIDTLLLRSLLDETLNRGPPRYNLVVGTLNPSSRIYFSTSWRTYIASFYLLQTYKNSRGFIITQNPLSSTIVDLYRLLYDKDVSIIVSFDDEKTTEVI